MTFEELKKYSNYYFVWWRLEIVVRPQRNTSQPSQTTWNKAASWIGTHAQSIACGEQVLTALCSVLNVSGCTISYRSIIAHLAHYAAHETQFVEGKCIEQTAAGVRVSAFYGIVTKKRGRYSDVEPQCKRQGGVSKKRKGRMRVLCGDA